MSGVGLLGNFLLGVSKGWQNQREWKDKEVTNTLARAAQFAQIGDTYENEADPEGASAVRANAAMQARDLVYKAQKIMDQKSIGVKFLEKIIPALKNKDGFDPRKIHKSVAGVFSPTGTTTGAASATQLPATGQADSSRPWMGPSGGQQATQETPALDQGAYVEGGETGLLPIMPRSRPEVPLNPVMTNTYGARGTPMPVGLSPEWAAYLASKSPASRRAIIDNYTALAMQAPLQERQQERQLRLQKALNLEQVGEAHRLQSKLGQEDAYRYLQSIGGPKVDASDEERNEYLKTASPEVQRTYTYLLTGYQTRPYGTGTPPRKADPKTGMPSVYSYYQDEWIPATPNAYEQQIIAYIESGRAADVDSAKKEWAKDLVSGRTLTLKGKQASIRAAEDLHALRQHTIQTWNSMKGDPDWKKKAGTLRASVERFAREQVKASLGVDPSRWGDAVAKAMEYHMIYNLGMKKEDAEYVLRLGAPGASDTEMENAIRDAIKAPGEGQPPKTGTRSNPP